MVAIFFSIETGPSPRFGAEATMNAAVCRACGIGLLVPLVVLNGVSLEMVCWRGILLRMPHDSNNLSITTSVLL